MDLPRFFQEKNVFSVIRNTFFFLKTPQPQRIPRNRIRCGRLPAASMWLRSQWAPHAIPRGDRAAPRVVGRCVAAPGLVQPQRIPA
jgi:hypothetical protein